MATVCQVLGSVPSTIQEKPVQINQEKGDISFSWMWRFILSQYSTYEGEAGGLTRVQGQFRE